MEGTGLLLLCLSNHDKGSLRSSLRHPRKVLAIASVFPAAAAAAAAAARLWRPSAALRHAPILPAVRCLRRPAGRTHPSQRLQAGQPRPPRHPFSLKRSALSCWTAQSVKRSLATSAARTSRSDQSEEVRAWRELNGALSLQTTISRQFPPGSLHGPKASSLHTSIGIVTSAISPQKKQQESGCPT